MKRTGTARKPLAKGESLHDRIDVELQQIQENRALVRSFFRAEHVSYISDLLLTTKTWRFLPGAGDIFGVAAAILMDALRRQFQQPVGECGQEVAVMRDE
jgi:hypothetical protein